MEVMCRDELVTDALPLEVSVDATAAEVLRDACALFGREEEHTALEVGGVWVADGDVPVSSLSLEADSTVVLRRSRARAIAIAAEWGNTRLHPSELPDWAWDDETVVLTAVSHCGLALEHASAALRDKEHVVREAVEEDAAALGYASPRLCGDEGFVHLLVGQKWQALQHASATLRDSEAVAGAAVQLSGHALRHSSDRLRGDAAFVLKAVRQKGLALEYASAALRDNETVVAAAVEESGYALQYASPRLRGDKAIVLKAVRRRGEALIYASAALRDNERVVAAAVKHDKLAIIYASERLQERNGWHRFKGSVRDAVVRGFWRCAAGCCPGTPREE